jgi:serine/threonine protein kinase
MNGHEDNQLDSNNNIGEKNDVPDTNNDGKCPAINNTDQTSNQPVSATPEKNHVDDRPIKNLKTGKNLLSHLQIYYDKNLGRGSFSKVFPGRYKGNLVAVKIISTRHLEERIIKQLQRELQIIRILKEHPHPNIVNYYKIFETDEKMIIVMELCSGGELSKYIKTGLEINTVCEYFSQILDGYKHLLELNIIHRDIKSANLLLSQDKKTVKFIDFGLSKIISTDLSQTICGSPLYMAPELLNHQDYDTKSDIWSLGVLLYEMIYGTTPFHHCKVIKTLKKSVQDNAIKYSEKSIDGIYTVPVEVIVYMKRLLEPNPKQRIDWGKIYDTRWLKDRIDKTTVGSVDKKMSKKKSIDLGIIDNYINNNDLTDDDSGSDSVFDIKEMIRQNEKNDNDNIFNEDDIDITTTDRSKSQHATSSPIPIKMIDRTKNKYPDQHTTQSGQAERIRGSEQIRGSNLQLNRTHRQSINRTPPILNRYSYDSPIPNIKGIRGGESFDEPLGQNIRIDDISMIDNSIGDEYTHIIRQQKMRATDSGLIDITDVNDIMISNVPERTTAYEYICRGSSVIGSYIYSKSAPIASSVINGISKVAKRTVSAIGQITPTS